MSALVYAHVLSQSMSGQCFSGNKFAFWPNRGRIAYVKARVKVRCTAKKKIISQKKNMRALVFVVFIQDSESSLHSTYAKATQHSFPPPIQTQSAYIQQSRSRTYGRSTNGKGLLMELSKSNNKQESFTSFRSLNLVWRLGVQTTTLLT